MRTVLPSLLLLATLTACSDRSPQQAPPPASAEPSVATASDGVEYLSHRIVVRRAPGASEADLEAAVARLGGRIVGRGSLLERRLGFLRVELPPEIEADEAIERLSHEGAIDDAERDVIYRVDAIPDDPQLTQLWGLAKIGAPAAWEQTTGSSDVTVAVIDTGSDLDHPDLAPNLWRNSGEIAGNGVDDDGNGYVDDVFGWDTYHDDATPEDDHGHGSHVAGTIGARGDDGLGIVGVNWDVRIISLKTCSASGSCPSTATTEAILYAAAMGARVVNASLGGPGKVSYMQEAIEQLEEAGGLLVAAAGNDGTNNDAWPQYPASYEVDNVVAVAASTGSDGLATFSNWGVERVDIAAPGTGILSALPGGGYGSMSGTSMATPHVAGAAALYFAKHPSRDYVAARDELLGSCVETDGLRNRVKCGGRLDLGTLVTPSPCDNGSHDCAPEATCIDTGPGAYRCECQEGYTGSGTTCDDVDECELDPEACGPHGTCVNTVGAFECACDPGWQAQGQSCVDVDECAQGTDDCGAHATCSNTEGSFSCACEEGWQGDGKTCADVDECLTATHTCSEHASCSNTEGSYTCSCDEGWAGDGFFCDDADECADGTHDCGALAICSNTEGGFSCSCAPGYAGDGQTCTDVDECADGSHGCDANATCANTVGGFTCTCAAGYAGDGQTCTDVDECTLGTDDCGANAVCTNTPGSFTCACAAGYDGDGQSCTDVDECADGSHDCDPNATCANTPGSFVCTCLTGFTGDGKSCADEDECQTGTAACSPDATCTNSFGSYSCACNEGFSGDGFNCGDLDECALGLDACDPLATCVNQNGSYDCVCPAGYTGDGLFCADVDECVSGAHDCDPNATCTNLTGGFACACNPGYSGDGTICSDVNECFLGVDDCDEHAECTNTDGSFTCACDPGFLGDGKTCTDVDECAEGTAVCDPRAACGNTPGSYECTCEPGWQGDGSSCTDVDECTAGTDDCDANATCTNTPGNHACSCNPGWEGTGTTCDDVDECAEGTDDCAPLATCTNTTGGYTCTCPAGYSGDGTTCVDVNECTNGTAVCSGAAVCSNTEGGYECVCPAGQEGDGSGGCQPPDECAYGTHGCDANATCTNTAQSYTCACNAGYTGDGFTCFEIDECTAGTDDCVAGATCVNESGGFACTCPAGYAGDGKTSGTGCADVDECADGSHACGATGTCANTVGSYTCTCGPGYTGDGQSCWDENECALGTDDCGAHAICSNTDGGWTCACAPGYSGDGITCVDVDECTAGTHDCDASATCSNTAGGYECTCPLGSTSNGTACVPDSDVDECAQGTHDCDPSATCINTDGGWACVCPAGYVGDGQSCTDEDECATPGTCDADATCTNLPGGYSCACKAGFVGDGANCADVDECAQGTHGCDVNATCTNTLGGYLCECDAGFAGDGTVCHPDECAQGTHDCHPDATCTDTPSGWTCACDPGFTGDGVICADVDECTAGTDDCDPSATCANTVGGFTCTCPAGTTGDGTSCTDLDECTLAIDTCDPHATCTDVPGSYTCACDGGFSGDGYTCVDDDECTDGTDGCDPNATCSNTEGSYQCTCPADWSGDGFSCAPDECALGTHDCAPTASCTDTPTGWTCACPEGLAGDGTSCSDVDECLDGTHACDANATCTNTVGGYDCTCGGGWVGDGWVCHPEPTYVTGVTAGGDHTCALLDNGGVRCWGRNIYGQLGYGHVDTVGDDEQPDSAGWVPIGATATRVATGVAHTCVLTDTGSVRCWGRNNHGQLGYGHTMRIGDDEYPLTQGDVNLGGIAVDVAAGGEHTCALLDDGAVRCWGLAINGQLGYGNQDDIGDDEPPAAAGDVPLGGPAIAIAAGRDHTCAVLQGGALRCWGRGDYGVLGYGDELTVGDDETAASAGDVGVGGNVVDVDAGWFHTCVVLDTGDVRCWGYGYTGQLGYGNPFDIGDDELPLTAGDVDTGIDVDQVALGPYHTCAHGSGGTVRCWGWGAEGRLGYASTYNVGDNEAPSSAGDVDVGGTVIELTAGYAHTCALLDSGVVKCWGDGAYGQLGAGSTADIGDDETPNGAAAALVGDVNECAADLDDCGPQAICTDLAEGWLCSCQPGFTGDGYICNDTDECAGVNACDPSALCENTFGSYTCTCPAGYTGDGTVCTDVDECAEGTHDCHAFASCLNGPGGYTCDCDPGWEGDGTSCAPVTTHVVELAAGKLHTCALLDDGAVRCWGRGTSGRLGYGNTAHIGDNEAPWNVGDVALGGVATQITAGDEHTCALLDTGDVRCWGRGLDGRLGLGNEDDVGDDELPSAVPPVALGGTAVAIAAGGAHTCALLQTGAVRCWGSGDAGRLGYGNLASIGDDEDPSSAGDVPLGTTAVAISTGQAHTCALLQGGGVRCWGENLDGQLGLGHTDDVGDDETPASEPQVALGGNVVSVSAGELHTCAVLDDGDVRCWGQGLFGLLGTGNQTTIGDDELPVAANPVQIGMAAVTVSVGEYHTCALRVDDQVVCWGFGASGRLGYGHTFTVGDNEDPTWAGTVSVGGATTQVVAGGLHSCALLQSTDVVCWGSGSYGQLGYGSFATIGDDELPSSQTPVAVLGG